MRESVLDIKIWILFAMHMGMYGLSRQKVTNLWADNTYRRLSVNGAWLALVL